MPSNLLKIIIRLIGILFAFVFVLYLAVLLLFPRNFNVNAMKKSVEQEISKQTGLNVGIENISVRTSLSPFLYLDAYHVVFLYPDKKELLKVKDLNIKVQVLPIVFKKIKIDKIIVNRPVLSFSIDKDGKTSLDKYLKNSCKIGGDFGGFSFDEKTPDIIVNRYRVKVYDSMYSSPFLIEGDNFLISQSKIHKGGVKIVTSGNLKYRDKTHISYNSEIETTFPENKDRIFYTNPFRYIKQFDMKTQIVSKFLLKKNNDKVKLSGTADINNLAFTLDNKRLENSHISLKINDNKISVNSDINMGGSDKLYVSGIVGTGKNSYVDLKCVANSMNIEAFKESAQAVLNAMNIKNELALYKITGLASFDFKIKSNFKTIQSQGNAEIKNATISGKSIPYSVSGINSKVDFNNNKIIIEPSEMLVNGTAITLKGAIDEKTAMDIDICGKNLSAEKISKLFFPKEIIKDNEFFGKMGFDIKVTGKIKEPICTISSDLDNFTVKNNGNAINFLKGKVLLSGTQSEPKGIIQLSKVDILPKDSKKLSADKMVLNFNSKTIEIPETIIKSEKTPLVASGKIENFDKKDFSYNFKFNGDINANELYSLLKQNGAVKDISAATKGVIGVSGKISGKGKKADIQAEFTADKNNYISAVVIRELLNKPSKTLLEASINENDIYIKNLSLSENGGSSIVSVQGKIKNLKSPQLENLRIVVPVAMTFSASRFKNSEITIKSDLKLNGNINKPDIQGSLDVKNVVIPEYKLRSSVNNIKFEQGNIKIAIPKLEIGKSKFDVSALVLPNFGKQAVLKDLHFKSDYLDMDEVNEALEGAVSNPVYPGVKIPFTAQSGKAQIKSFKTGSLHAENVNCDISIANNVLKMKNISGTAYNGILNGEAEYNFLHTSTIINLVGKNAQIRQVIRDLTGKADETTGVADYKLKLSTIGTRTQQQQRTAKGYFEYTAKNGVLGPLGQFEHFLYAQNLISQSILKTTLLAVRKAVKPQNTGVYTVSNGKIDIHGGNAYLKPVTVEGPNMSLYITGKISILNDLADIKIYGRISQEVERVLGDLTNPVPRTILSKSSETSIGNLFYDEYNTNVPKSIMDAIPQLNPQTGFSSRPFAVTIQGSPDSVKAVKSFKWIVSTTTAPVPKASDVEHQINKQVPNVNIHENGSKPENKSNNNGNATVPSTPQKQEAQPVKSTEISTTPSFLDSLPDDFN